LTLDIVRVTPESPSGLLAAWTALYAALVQETSPGGPMPDLQEARAALECDDELEVSVLLANVDETPVAAAIADTWLREESHRPHVDLIVDAAHRRRGIGRALATEMLDLLRSQGRQAAIVDVIENGAGQRLAESFGGRVTQRDVMSRLDIAGLDALPLREWARPPDGYRLESWDGHCPDELVRGFARCRESMNDRPRGSAEKIDWTWDADRVRAWEERHRRSGYRMLTTAAVAAPGDIAGFTEMLLRDNDRTGVWQEDTAVVAAHRGHGLGLVVKAANLLRLHETAPQARRIVTWNAADNTFMRTVNERFGFRPVHHISEISIPLA
jgi:GNAT superfamily N-acetyltransferase